MICRPSYDHEMYVEWTRNGTGTVQYNGVKIYVFFVSELPQYTFKSGCNIHRLGSAQTKVSVKTSDMVFLPSLHKDFTCVTTSSTKFCFNGLLVCTSTRVCV